MDKLYQVIMKKTAGIITLHKINNYGSVLQAYALQNRCEMLGWIAEIIDYDFPNAFHRGQTTVDERPQILSRKELVLKYLYGVGLYKQHKGIRNFVQQHQNLSVTNFSLPEDLQGESLAYCTYITGSDQLWNPRYCKGDLSFLLNFAPDEANKISYASSFGKAELDEKYKAEFRKYLSRYSAISVREKTGVGIVEELTGKPAELVVDPTLLLSADDWNKIAVPKRLVKKKYILCYFLNYTFDAFPYVQEFSDYVQKETGYELVWVARPSKRFVNPHTKFFIGASPEEFLALIRDCEMVLTTSFHGTAFAVNYGKPVYSIIEDVKASDSRQKSLMDCVGLNDRIISIKNSFPKKVDFLYDTTEANKNLQALREHSINFLKKALNNE